MEAAHPLETGAAHRQKMDAPLEARAAHPQKTDAPLETELSP
jgi:hypothetical protein